MELDAAPVDIGLLLERIRAGDEEAAGLLVSHLRPLVMKIARAHLPVRQTEDDLAQEVYGRLFERLARYEARPGVPFEHWVSRLAVRTCLDLLRAERRRPEVRAVDLGEGESDWLEYLTTDRNDAGPPATEAADARDLIERLLGQLGPEDRLVISLMDLEERSAAEVAGLTGWSAVGVRVRAFRARARLRKAATIFCEKGQA